MARHYDLRRSTKSYCDNVEDASQRLRHFIVKNNLVNVAGIKEIMSNLPTASLPMVQSAIDRAENSLVIMNTLLDVLKNEKKFKESLIKVFNLHLVL